MLCDARDILNHVAKEYMYLKPDINRIDVIDCAAFEPTVKPSLLEYHCVIQ